MNQQQEVFILSNFIEWFGGPIEIAIGYDIEEYILVEMPDGFDEHEVRKFLTSVLS